MYIDGVFLLYAEVVLCKIIFELASLFCFTWIRYHRLLFWPGGRCGGLHKLAPLCGYNLHGFYLPFRTAGYPSTMPDFAKGNGRAHRHRVARWNQSCIGKPPCRFWVLSKPSWHFPSNATWANNLHIFVNKTLSVKIAELQKPNAYLNIKTNYRKKEVENDVGYSFLLI